MSFAARLKILPQNSEEKPRNLPGLYFFSSFRLRP
jgi:hypothetical protein